MTHTEKLTEEVMKIYGGRQLFAGINQEDLERTVTQIVGHVAMATEAIVNARKKRKMVFIHSVQSPQMAQDFINELTAKHEVESIDVKPTERALYITIVVLINQTT